MKLERNFALMFWIQALLETKMINVVASIFLVFRGLNLSQIFYLSVTFSVVTLLTELPSSYLADKWGRKKVLMMATGLNLLYGIICFFARGFWPFMIAFAIFALSTALYSGTDEALIYDTSKNLGEEENSLKKLGQYFSAQRIFKIFTSIVAVLIVKNLSNEQFMWLLSIDSLALLGAFILSMLLVEPKVHYRVEAVKLGVLKDAWELMKSESEMVRIIISKTLIFIASFLIWRIYSEYFRQLSAPIILIGVMTASYQLIIFLLNIRVHKLFINKEIESRLNFLNIIFTLSVALFLVNQILWKNLWVAVGCFVFLVVSESVRAPLYSQITNKLTKSYNRATTLSLVNLLNSALLVPLILVGSFLVAKGFVFLFGLSMALALVSILFFRLRSTVGTDGGGNGAGEA